MPETVSKLELPFTLGCEAIEGTVAIVNETLRELDLPAEVSEIMRIQKRKPGSSGFWILRPLG